MEKEIDMPRLEDLERVLVGEGLSYEALVWKIKGTDLCHHPTERAVQRKDGNWSWYWMDREHRWDGPAKFTKRKGYEWWINGDFLTREEWERHPQRLEWLRERARAI